MCRLLFSNGTSKNALQKNARSASGAKEGPRDENNPCCQMGNDLAHCSLHRQRRAAREFETRMRCMSEVFTKTSCWWLNQSQQQKKPVSAINLRFSTCLWQTYHAIIQTIYTGMVTLRLMCKQCWTGKNQSRPVAVPWLAVRPGSKSSKID